VRTPSSSQMSLQLAVSPGVFFAMISFPCR
jgi:hypothetical protein